MNTGLISFLIGGSFGIFLTLQYIIFYIFFSKNKDLKKTKNDLLFILLIGVIIVTTNIIGAFALNSSIGFDYLYKLMVILGIICLFFFVLLLRYILVSIKDMTFVETDDFKQKNQKYLTGLFAINVILIICVLLSNIKALEPLYFGFLMVIIGYIPAILIIEVIEFKKILKNDSGKITPLTRIRFQVILWGGITATLSGIAEVIIILSGSKELFMTFGSLYAYGLDVLAIALSLNFIFEYMEVLTRASETNKKLSELNKQIMDDIRTAQSLQISLLPLDKQKIIQNFIDMEISYMPMQSVGGDYYDFYQLDDKNFLIFLGDASGHGVYAAMIWAMLKVEVEELIEDKQFSNLSQAFTLLNQRITRILENTYSYATLFACLINLENLTVSYISAGHTDQFFYQSQDGAVTKIRNKNPIIGTFKNARFTADTITCRPGDAILMFSDGIVEGTNPEGDMLGKERLEPMFLTAAGPGSASDIISSLLINLEEFFEGSLQKDDRTLLVIKL